MKEAGQAEITKVSTADAQQLQKAVAFGFGSQWRAASSGKRTLLNPKVGSVIFPPLAEFQHGRYRDSSNLSV